MPSAEERSCAARYDLLDAPIARASLKRSAGKSVAELEHSALKVMQKRLSLPRLRGRGREGRRRHELITACNGMAPRNEDAALPARLQ